MLKLTLLKQKMLFPGVVGATATDPGTIRALALRSSVHFGVMSVFLAGLGGLFV